MVLRLVLDHSFLPTNRIKCVCVKMCTFSFHIKKFDRKAKKKRLIQIHATTNEKANAKSVRQPKNYDLLTHSQHLHFVDRQHHQHVMFRCK